jgi:hypothetical protein
MRPKFVLFRKTKLIAFALKLDHERKQTPNLELRKALDGLYDLTIECAASIRNRKQHRAMLEKLENLPPYETKAATILEQMLNGTHSDVPDWMKK